MFLTTLDILYFVLAIAVGLIAVFTCWFMFYLVMMVRDARKIIKEMREQIENFLGAARKFCDKFDSVSGYFMLLVDVARELLRHFTSKGSKNKKQK